MAKLKAFRLVDSKSKVCECHYISINIYINTVYIFYISFFLQSGYLYV